MIKLYNTLTKKIDLFKPITENKLKIYTCGPTVYDYSHIGHWYTYVRVDVLIRLFNFLGYEITWVMNITDVGHLVSDADDGEDKLQKKARQTDKTAWQVAEYYTKEFVEGLNMLNITFPTKLVKATDHIKEQINLIERLEKKGVVYEINDGIYFNTARFSDYSSFAQLDIDEQQAGKRVEYNKQKINISDFALWKFSPKDSKRDMEWPSPWGIGFPGWHIECSAMSMKYLGDTFDIHTGGIDHIPVHHTNEIAQSQTATGKKLANYWFHSNHVTNNGEKISKSLNNGYTLNQLHEFGLSDQAIRLHILESHYRSQSKFSIDSVVSSSNRLKSWSTIAALSFQLKQTTNETNFLIDYQKTIIEALSSDLNTPLVLSTIDESFDKIWLNLNSFTGNTIISYLNFINQVIGINLLNIEDLSSEDYLLIKRRLDYRANNEWVKSDEIRDHLKNKGIGLRDLDDKSYWFYYL